MTRCGTLSLDSLVYVPYTGEAEDEAGRVHSHEPRHQRPEAPAARIPHCHLRGDQGERDQNDHCQTGEITNQ